MKNKALGDVSRDKYTPSRALFFIQMHSGALIYSYIYILICYNTAAKGLTDIYMRLLRAHSARGRVRI